MDDTKKSIQRSLSKLSDGTILLIGPDCTDALVYRDSTWQRAEGITLDEVTGSKPLTDAEIADLEAEGILPD